MDPHQDEEHAMLYSRSTGALLNRLRPVNDNLTASMKKGPGHSPSTPSLHFNHTQSTTNLNTTTSTFNTLKPKLISTSSSTPNLHNNINPSNNVSPKKLTSSSSSKVLKLRQNIITNKAISTSSYLSTSETNMPTEDFIEENKKKELEIENSEHEKTLNKSYSSNNFNEYLDEKPVLSRTLTSNLGETGLLISMETSEGQLNIQKNSFIASLNLTHKQLHDLFKVPHTFYYLRQKNSVISSTSNEEKNQNDTNQTRTFSINLSNSVYDLEIIPLELVDKQNYFTLSKEGITQFQNKVSTFTTLKQWEREYKLYHKISQINFFLLYKKWKSFKLWYKILRKKKMSAYSKVLSNNLFLFNPPLYNSIVTIRNLTLNISNNGMLNIQKNHVYNLNEFIQEQDEIYSNLLISFKNLNNNIITTIRSACDEVIDHFLKVNNIIANHKMTFMERAALRYECKKLTRFLRMIDIYIGDFFKSMIHDSMIKLFNSIKIDESIFLNNSEQKDSENSNSSTTTIINSSNQNSYIIPPLIITDDSIEIDSIEIKKQRDANKVQTPLFRVIAKLNYNHLENPTELSTSSSDEIIELMPSCPTLINQLDHILNRLLDITSSFNKVLTSVETEMYVMPEGDEEDDDAVEQDELIDVIKSSEFYISMKENIESHIKLAYHSVYDYLEVFLPYHQIFVKNNESLNNISLLFPTGEIDSFQYFISDYREQINKFKQVPRYANIGVLFIDSVNVKETMVPSPVNCLKAIQNYLPELVVSKAQALLDEVSNINPILSSEPNSVESYVNKKKLKDLATTEYDNYMNKQSYIRSIIHLMDDNGWSSHDQMKALMRMLKDTLVNLESNLQLAEGKEEEEIKKFSIQVNDECPKIVKKLIEIREQLDISLISDPSSLDEKVCKYLNQKEYDFNKLKSRCEKLQEYQTILRLNVDDFELIEEIQSDLNLKTRLWNDKFSWKQLYDKIIVSPLNELDVANLEKELVKYNKTVNICSKGLPLNKVVPLFKASVDEINPILPIAIDLRNPALKERHRVLISNLVGFNISESDSFTLKDVIERGVTKYQEEITSIATSAQQEAILEEMLAKVVGVWENMKFEVKPYKDVKDLYILGDTSEIIAALDDSLVTINTILGSRYVSGIRTTVDNWRTKLMLMQETLDEWLNCQRNWMYLETIFSSPDIIKQLPGPAKVFQTVDKSWKLIMKQTNDEPLVIKATTNDRNRKELFKSHNHNLEQIQKDLEDYLETKRSAFPRFYFLSNDELLEILSQAKDPRAVQPHLRKCFDNLVKLEFSSGNLDNNMSSGTLDITAMHSSEGEIVQLKTLKAKGNVEEWLGNVEFRMKEDLRALMKKGVESYDPSSRDSWVFDHPGQVVATVAQITWASGTEQVLRNREKAHNNEGKVSGTEDGLIEVNDALLSTNPMKIWYEECKDQLQKLIQLIRGDLTPLHRAIIVALVTTDVHARDIVEELLERDVQNHYDFLWQQQLRYYWNVDLSTCIIKHSDAVVNYGYEYMGATSRLVITPLTDRCWLTLTGSYALKLGAAPAGPAGTGKTESSKDLAKAMGIQCVVFNCSDQIDYKMMGKLFRGLAQGGAWICLDEFNRIDIEVLSVIAQQMLVLREGRIAGLSHINFMEIPIRLVDHHVIITMNPGYAGRTELPDNLAVCFRPVSMMVPNYALIAEIMLFAEGFGDAKNLSRKMCKLYILCSEQLSQQPHYDYGLRAVKSVLVMAGSLKRSNPTTDEELVLIRALVDSNVPKFLSDDLPLFAAIVQDLFPGVNIPQNDYGELQVALEEELNKANLQIVPGFVTKIIQMFDIFNIRFGATLVGPAATGKTTVYKILASLMINLRSKGSKNPQFQKVTFKVLNPKSITMGELYGEFNPLTQEWHDGLASSIMREFVAEETPDKRWTVFDGPIEALWIENMNTVLDDNMTLCLANGQRIKLKSEMKCLFEVNDLAAASPATVSRIGVVYISPTDLGWLPFTKTWVKTKLTDRATQEMRDRIVFLFEKTFSKGLAYQRKFGVEPVATVDMQLVMSMCALFESLFSEANGVDFNLPPADLITLLDRIFFFSYVWSVGISCSSDFWDNFSDYSRELFEETCPSLALPNDGNAFDFFVDIKENKFRNWTEIIPKFNYSDDAPYFSLIVPTIDTCRFSYVMKSLITVNKPVFVTGITGTGKTVLVQSLIQQLQAPIEEDGLNVMPLFMSFSAQTRSDVAQSTIESKLEKKRKNLLAPANNKKGIVFVDDVNMPTVETYGAQPPVELLRQFLDLKGFYDRDKLFWKEIQEVLLFVGAAPPGGGRSSVTPRFTRHFNVLCLPPASDSALSMIFSSILNGFLAPFEPEIIKLVGGIVSATIEIYSKISMELLPTPSKFHYTFNLRDISKVFQGILMVKPRKVNTVETFVRLWVHECSRIFYDRLINREDQEWFEKTTVELCSRYLRLPLTQDDLFKKPIIFIDFIRPDSDVKFYEEIKDYNKIVSVLDNYLDNYNVTYPSQMNLVFFQDALTHTAKIARILRQPRGNAMLIGVGGSGKQSLTRMAAFVCGMQCLSIEINRGYGINEFREDIKKFMWKTGVEGKDTVFLFTDSQIVDETMLEDLNNVLNTGEVSNLYAQDETDKIVSEMFSVCKANNIPETRENCLNYFVSRVRDKLHIVLCMSPVGDALRIRCRQFPSLINCTTIDWFHGWPEDALVSVAERLLGDIDLPSEEIYKSVVKMCGYVHRSIEITSDRFYNELKRRVYTTPKSYLDLISLYISMLKNLQNVVEAKCDRMKVGVAKLNETNSLVANLKQDLIKMEPILKEKGIQTSALLQDVEKQKSEASLVAIRVGKEEAEAKKQAEETAIIAKDAENDLATVQPALDKAAKAIDSLSKSDITEIKSYSIPPTPVKTLMESVCLLLGEKESWENAKKLVSRSDFLDLLKKYNKDNIPPKMLDNLRKYLQDPVMTDQVMEKVSKAAFGIFQWVKAMEQYSTVFIVVAPKRAKLAEMNAQLALTMADLKEKELQLKNIMDRVADLQKKCDETVAERDRLQFESDTTAKRLVRAEKLTSGLNSEGVRWKENIKNLTNEKISLIGDTFLSCACISYYGSFTGDYRENLIKDWLEKMTNFSIPSSSSFSLVNTLGDPVMIREWQTQGLPTDNVSVDNAILVDKCRRWPLMIDPQMQANQWIKKKYSKNNIEITSMRDTNLLRTLENCIRLGKSLLLEDIGEAIEPALEPVLLKAIFKQGNRSLIRLGDSDVDYHPDFKLYMTTKLPNPHYLPEVCIKVTIINFTVTMAGLEAQLLGQVVKSERPDIENKRIELMLQMAEDKKELANLEAKILKLLSESQGNILDDEVLINTLSESKVTAISIEERVGDAEVTEIAINEARSRYQSVAIRGSIIYFVIADLSLIDPMYQYSLLYYKNLFQRCINDSEKSNDLHQRLNNIITYSTRNIYNNICRGLFQKDKLLFSSMICFQILKHEAEIKPSEWNLFLRGSSLMDKSSLPKNPYPNVFSQSQWELIYSAESSLKNEKIEEGEESTSTISYYPFANITASLTNDYKGRSEPSVWSTWMESPNIFTATLPGDYNSTINSFQKLILIKALREDRLQFAIGQYVKEKLGSEFIMSTSAGMEEIYNDLDNITPCIFVLSSGADPTGMLLRFAKKMNYADRLHIVSLGQGQGPYAKSLIDKAVHNGDWVVLQNCMLAKSWMPELDKIITDLQERGKAQPKDIDLNNPPKGFIHPDFRLYLTSTPASYFPVSILQNGVKMTNEPPKGFRANLQRSFNNLVKQEDFEYGLLEEKYKTEEENGDVLGDEEKMKQRELNKQFLNKQNQFKKLLVSLSFFHANIQERRKFGPLGWNIRYAFDESDLETSIAVLRRFLKEQEVLPWDALNYVTGQINYGGRVTDDWDRRCLMSILSIYLTPNVLEDSYIFSSSGIYYAPSSTSTYNNVLEYFNNLPNIDDPEVFGMHDNANVTFNLNETVNLMSSMLSLQPKSTGSGDGQSSALSNDDIVLNLIDNYEQLCPELLNEEEAGPTTFVIQSNGLLDSLAICLLQEISKFNLLLKSIKINLNELKRAIKGFIIMNSDLDLMYTSFLYNLLPKIWEKINFATLKNLNSWYNDLIGRIKFLKYWILYGKPVVFPISIFFFPQGFMTASLQMFSRKYQVSIDTLNFRFSVLNNDEIKTYNIDTIINQIENNIPPTPELSIENLDSRFTDGVIVNGLYLEGARYNREDCCVAPSNPGEMFDLLPPIHFIPTVGHKQAPNTYACPVYKTAVRKGVLSTTGMSTNFVLAIELPLGDNNSTEQQWILAGVAALLNLTD